MTARSFTETGQLLGRLGRTEGLLGVLIVVAYTATLPFLAGLSPGGQPILPFVGLGVVFSILLILKYPGALFGMYAGGVFSLPLFFVPAEQNPVKGWALLPVVAIAIYLLAQRKRVSFPVDAAVLSQVALAIALCVGVTYTSGRADEAMQKAWGFIYLNLFVFAGPMFFIGDQRRQRNILICYGVGAVLWSIAVYLCGETAQGRLSFEGISGPIVYGRAAGIASSLAACWLLTNPRSPTNLAAVPLGAFLLYGTVLSGTRGALLAFLVALLVAILLSQIRARTAFHLMVGCLAATAVAVFVVNLVGTAPAELLGRYAELSEGAAGESASERLYLYSIAADMLRESPILGRGTAAYPARWQYPHNLFLEVGAELGIAGLLALSTLLAVVIRYVCRVMYRPEYDAAQKRMMVFLGAGLAFFLTEAQFSCGITDNRPIWFFCGLICAVHATKGAGVALAQLRGGVRRDPGRRHLEGTGTLLR